MADNKWQRSDGLAAKAYAAGGADGRRAPPASSLEIVVRAREHEAFLAGAKWERERAAEVGWTAFVRDAPVFSQVRVPPGYRARHEAGRMLENPNSFTLLIPSLPTRVHEWTLEKM